MALLTVRDRTRSGLARLLASRGFAPRAVKTTLDRLMEQGYLDDRRFATTWARSRLRTKPMGPYRLRHELEAKGVEDHVVREVLKDLYEDGEAAAARRAMASKALGFRDLPAGSRTGRLARFLQRRGFSNEVIWRLLRENQRSDRGNE